MIDENKKNSPLTESTLYILLAAQKPLHGYGIIKEVEDLTKGRLVLSAGTLYGAIQNLVKQELLALDRVDIMNKRRKEYLITEKGKVVLRYEVKRLKEVLRNVKSRIETDNKL